MLLIGKVYLLGEIRIIKKGWKDEWLEGDWGD